MLTIIQIAFKSYALHINTRNIFLLACKRIPVRGYCLKQGVNWNRWYIIILGNLLWFSIEVLSEVKKDHSNPFICYFLFITFEFFNLTRKIPFLKLVLGLNERKWRKGNKTAKCKSVQFSTDIWALLLRIWIELQSRDLLQRKHIIHCYAYIPLSH